MDFVNRDDIFRCVYPTAPISRNLSADLRENVLQAVGYLGCLNGMFNKVSTLVVKSDSGFEPLEGEAFQCAVCGTLYYEHDGEVYMYFKNSWRNIEDVKTAYGVITDMKLLTEINSGRYTGEVIDTLHVDPKTGITARKGLDKFNV